jgi:hypothetical protein
MRFKALAVGALAVVALSVSACGSSGAPVTQAYWYDLGHKLGTTAVANASGLDLNNTTAAGSTEPPTNAFGWCSDLLYNQEPPAVSRVVTQIATEQSKNLTSSAEESRWENQGCEAAYAVYQVSQAEQQAASNPGLLPSPTPVAAVPIRQQPGYRVGYRIGRQNASTLAAEDSASGSSSDFASVPLADVQSWCDEYADPNNTYAPPVTYSNGAQVDGTDPATAGCIAGMKSKGAGK